MLNKSSNGTSLAAFQLNYLNLLRFIQVVDKLNEAVFCAYEIQGHGNTAYCSEINFIKKSLT